jgi:hypothetical protein
MKLVALETLKSKIKMRSEISTKLQEHSKMTLEIKKEIQKRNEQK